LTAGYTAFENRSDTHQLYNKQPNLCIIHTQPKCIYHR
jgi:hypothetical protein